MPSSIDRRRTRALTAAVLLLPSPLLGVTYNLGNTTVPLPNPAYTAADTLSVSGTTFTATNPVSLASTVQVNFPGVTFAGPADMTLAGALTGGGEVFKTGTGALTLAAPSPSYTGFSVSGSSGTVRLVDPLALGPAGAPTLSLGVALDVSASLPARTVRLAGTLLNNSATPVTLGPSLSLANNASAFTLSGTGDLTFASPLPTALSLTKTGAGTATYSVPTTFTATHTTFSSAINVNAGTLRLGTSAPFAGASMIAVNSNGTLDLNGFAPGVPVTLRRNGTLANNNPSVTATLATLPTFDDSYEGYHYFGGAGHLDVTATLPSRTFAKSGSGTLTLSADNTGYNRTIRVTAGTLRLGHPSGAGNGPSGGFGPSVDLQPGSAFDLNGYAPPNIAVSFNGGALVNDNTSNPVTLSTAAPFLSVISPVALGGAGELILTRSITTAFTKIGAGTLTLNRPTGTVATVTVNAGSVRPGHATALLSGSKVTVNAGGAFDLNGMPMPAGVTVTLANGAVVNNNLATPVTLNSPPAYDPSEITYRQPAFGGAGTLNLNFPSLPGVRVLNKVGAGLLTLPQNFSAYAFDLHQGTLHAEFQSQLNGNSGYYTPVEFLGGTLRTGPLKSPPAASYSFANDLWVGPAGGTLETLADTTFSTGLVGTGTLTKIGTGTLTLAPNFASGAGLTINQGKLNVLSFYQSASNFIALTLNTDNALLGTTNYHLASLAGPGAISGRTVTIYGGPAGIPRPTTYSGTLTNSSLSLSGTGQLTVTGSVQSSVSVQGGSLTLGDGGTTGTITGSIYLSSVGALILNRSDDFSLAPAISGSGTVTKKNPGTASINLYPSQALKLDVLAGTLRLLPLTATPTITSLTLAAADGSIDLASNNLVINYTGVTPLATLRQHLLSHRLFSSTADTDPAGLSALAITEASAILAFTGLTATWSGQTVDSTSVLIKRTLIGDANFNGEIDSDDFSLLDRSFAISRTNALWTHGDFSYDGIVNSEDYFLIDRTYLSQAPGMNPELLAMRHAQFGAEYVQQLLASVPEPASIAAWGMALPLLLPGRRRKVR